jgi:hypothetical protein
MPRAPGKRNLTIDQKMEIMLRHERGESLQEIGNLMNIPKATVGYAYKVCKTRNSIISPKHGGQNKISTPADDYALLQIVDGNPLATLIDIQREWRLRNNVNAAKPTICQKLRKNDSFPDRLRACVAVNGEITKY